MYSTEEMPTHIEIISTLVAEGKTDAEIANQLIDKGLVNLSYDEVFWEDVDVKKIRHQYYFAQRGMKLCPECKSEIRRKATVCRFCKSEIETVQESAQEEETVIAQSSYQKLFTLGMLISFSFMLHIIFCTWRYGVYDAHIETIESFNRDYSKGVIIGLNDDVGYGIYASDLLNGNAMLGLTFGVLLPVVLLGASAFLYIGWQADIKRIFKKTS